MTERRGGRNRSPGTETPRSHSYRQLRHPFAPQSVFSDDAIANIHGMSLRVLSELGLKILHPEARSILKSAGALVDDSSQIVRIGPDMVAAALAAAPRSIHMRAANPARAQIFEPGALLFSPGSGCPNVQDRLRGRRAGSLETFHETLKLQQHFDVIHLFGPLCRTAGRGPEPAPSGHDARPTHLG